MAEIKLNRSFKNKNQRHDEQDADKNKLQADHMKLYEKYFTYLIDLASV